MMSKITTICGVLCLVLFAEICLTVAQTDIGAIERVIKNTMKEFNQQMMDTLQVYLQHHNMEQQYACDNEFEILRNISQAQEEVVSRKITSFEATVELIIESGKQFEQRYKADLEKLQTTNAKVLAINSDLQRQLKSLQDELKQVYENIIPTSCASLNAKDTDFYYINPAGWGANAFLVLCDFENHFNQGGGWTVFQRRIDGSVDFFRNWTMYKHGFGDVNGEHWLGLEKLHIMTRSGRHELLVLLEDFDGNSTYAFYDEFKIASEAEKYKLTIGNYSGITGDSLHRCNGLKFSTLDNDDTTNHLASILKGAWWFNSNWSVHLNAPYFPKGQHKQWGVGWDSFRYGYSLKSATMMFRSRAFN